MTRTPTRATTSCPGGWAWPPRPTPPADRPAGGKRSRSSASQRRALRDREEARGLGRQRVQVGAPDGGELPSQRRPSDLDGDQPAEYEVVADGEPAEDARPDAFRDRRTHRRARTEFHRDPRA